MESLVELAVGDVVMAKVKIAGKTYAKMTLGDVEAFLPATEYSWRKSVNLKNLLKEGEEIQTVVIAITEQGIMLSVKRLENNPWKTIDELYKVGQKIQCKVVSIVNYGAFVELSNGLQGLLHKKEMSLDGNIEPETIVAVGQEIEVIVSSINKDESKIALTIKPFITHN